MAEAVFQTAYEALGRLPPRRFAVALARMTQDDPIQVRPSPFAVCHHPGTQAKIHLRFNSRLDFHPTKGPFPSRLEPAHKPLYRVVAAGKLVFSNQVLVEALCRQTSLQPLLNEVTPRLALTATAHRQAGGHLGRLRDRFRPRRPGGQIGRFWLRHPLPSRGALWPVLKPDPVERIWKPSPGAVAVPGQSVGRTTRGSTRLISNVAGSF